MKVLKLLFEIFMVLYFLVAIFYLVVIFYSVAIILLPI
jgi:hypothetical protein